MKKLIFFFSFFFMVFNDGKAQDTLRDTSEEFSSVIAVFEIMYGNHIYPGTINRPWNSFRNYDFGKPVQSIGFSFSAEGIYNRRISIPLQFGYSIIIPQSITINDTLKGSIGGFNFKWPHVGINLMPYIPNLDLILGVGANYGRLRISTREYRAQKNPYFAPTVFFQPRIILNRLAISLRGEYQFDISKKTWKSVSLTEKEKGFALDKFDQTGLLLYFSLGWVLE